MSQSDEERVGDVLSRYCHYIDNLDETEWLALFTEDAVWAGGKYGTYKGRTEIAKLLNHGDAATAPAKRHLTLNRIATVKGSEANLKSYVMLLRHEKPGDMRIVTAGRYDIDLVKQGASWLIQSLRVDVELE